MFKVYEMIGNFSKEVAMFETETEASEYLMERREAYIDDNYDNLEKDEFGLISENEDELFYSYFSIDDDGRELISEDKLTEMYDSMLDECYPEMFGMSASLILYRADEIQYKCGLNDYYDSISDEYYCDEME